MRWRGEGEYEERRIGGKKDKETREEETSGNT